MVGKLYEYLVVSPPRTYPEFYQEVKDLLLLAARDFPELSLWNQVGTPIGYAEKKMDDWFEKWFDGIIPSSRGRVK